MIPIMPPSQVKEVMSPFDAELAKLDQELKISTERESTLAKSLQSSSASLLETRRPVRLTIPNHRPSLLRRIPKRRFFR